MSCCTGDQKKRFKLYSNTMYRLCVTREFTATHFLIGGDWGPENDPHSHDYKVELELEAGGLDEHGFVVDIVRVEQALEVTIAEYRGRTLNELPEFAGLNPSIEHFSRILHGHFKRDLSDQAKKITVKLWETGIAWVSYSEG